MIRFARHMALLAPFLPTAAFAACPTPGGTAPYTLLDDPVATTVYRDADGVTVLRVRQADGAIDTYESYRGLFMLSGPDGQGGGYVFEYGVPLDPVFRFAPGDRHEIPVTTTLENETVTHTDIYEIVDTATVAIGDCSFEAVVIDYAQRFDDATISTTTLYYAPDLGVVIQREIDHDFTAETPRITSRTDRITDDPATFVPR